MRKILLSLVLLLSPAAALAADHTLDWAYPNLPPGAKAPPDPAGAPSPPPAPA